MTNSGIDPGELSGRSGSGKALLSVPVTVVNPSPQGSQNRRGIVFAWLAWQMISQKARVLVVDDEPAIRALVAKIVERAGLTVDTAADGSIAIEMLSHTEYAAIVLDLMMPIVDGYGLIEHLKQRGGPRPAIIVISAGDSASLRQLDGAMVHSIIRKPFDIDVLGDLVVAAATTTMESAQQKDGDVLPFSRSENGS